MASNAGAKATGRGLDQDGLAVEQVDADHAHGADRAATPAEEEEADRARSQMSDEERSQVAEHYEHMSELGANVKGEGQIE